MTKEDPNCPKCGVKMTRLVSIFAAPWTGTLDRFDDPRKERVNNAGDGHFAWRVKSSRLPDHGPERVLIRTKQDQRELCRAEGLVDPSDVNPNSFISPDGKTLHTVGIGGAVWGPVKAKEDGTPWLDIE